MVVVGSIASALLVEAVVAVRLHVCAGSRRVAIWLVKNVTAITAGKNTRTIRSDNPFCAGLRCYLHYFLLWYHAEKEFSIGAGLTKKKNCTSIQRELRYQAVSATLQLEKSRRESPRTELIPKSVFVFRTALHSLRGEAQGPSDHVKRAIPKRLEDEGATEAW